MVVAGKAWCPETLAVAEGLSITTNGRSWCRAMRWSRVADRKLGSWRERLSSSIPFLPALLPLGRSRTALYGSPDGDGTWLRPGVGRWAASGKRYVQQLSALGQAIWLS